MTVEEFFDQWWPKELPTDGFNKTAMLDFAYLYHRHQVSIMDIPIVKQRRKLLLDFVKWKNEKDKIVHIDAKEVDEFLKSKNKITKNMQDIMQERKI